MSTPLLFTVAVLLVFSPFLLELLRAAGRLASARRRRERPPAPDFGATFESSVQSALYGNEPRWQKLDVTAADEQSRRPEPPYVVGRPETGAPLRDIRAEQPEPVEEEIAA